MPSTRRGAAPAIQWIRGLLSAHYGLDEMCAVEEIPGGYCNRSYRISCLAGRRHRKFLLRQYRSGTQAAEIRFEHALLQHLHDKGFDLSAQVVRCRNGASHVEAAPAGPPGLECFWALFTYLEGEDAYTWTRNDLAASEFDSAAEALALFHGAGVDFIRPAGAGRRQPPIVELLPRLTDTLAAGRHRAGNRSCDRLLRERFGGILVAVETCRRSAEGFEGMPRLPVHGDYHPGNLKYAGGRVTGLFDFDWSKIDYRLFDVALALVYFCATWDRTAPPVLRTGRMRRFLEVYDRTCAACGRLPRLGARELANLKAMLCAANLYVLNWDVTDYYSADDPDDAEYLFYLRHNIGLMDWIESHAEDVETLVESDRGPV